MINTEQNVEQYNRDKFSAELIEEGISEIQYILGSYHCCLIILIGALRNNELECVTYYKDDYVDDIEHSNNKSDNIKLQEYLSKYLSEKNKLTKEEFLQNFVLYKLGTTTLNQMLEAFKKAYKNKIFDMSENEYQNKINIINVNIKKIEQGQDDLISRHKGLVLSLINTKRKLITEADRDDLLQEGYIGLLTATEKYNYRRQTCFMTFAYYRVKQNIENTFSHQFKNIKIPANIANKITKIIYFEQKLFQKLGRKPTDDELSNQLDMDTEDLKEILYYKKSETISYNNRIIINNKEEDDFANNFADQDQRDVLDIINEEQIKVILSKLISTLKPQVKTILELRYGLDDNIPQTRDDIGVILGITGERVRQIENESLRQLAKNSEIIKIMDQIIYKKKPKYK